MYKLRSDKWGLFTFVELDLVSFFTTRCRPWISFPSVTATGLFHSCHSEMNPALFSSSVPVIIWCCLVSLITKWFDGKFDFLSQSVQNTCKDCRTSVHYSRLYLCSCSCGLLNHQSQSRYHPDSESSSQVWFKWWEVFLCCPFSPGSFRSWLSKSSKTKLWTYSATKRSPAVRIWLV